MLADRPRHDYRRAGRGICKPINHLPLLGGNVHAKSFDVDEDALKLFDEQHGGGLWHEESVSLVAEPAERVFDLLEPIESGRENSFATAKPGEDVLCVVGVDDKSEVLKIGVGVGRGSLVRLPTVGGNEGDVLETPLIFAFADQRRNWGQRKRFFHRRMCSS